MSNNLLARISITCPLGYPLSYWDNTTDLVVLALSGYKLDLEKDKIVIADSEESHQIDLTLIQVNDHLYTTTLQGPVHQFEDKTVTFQLCRNGVVLSNLVDLLVLTKSAGDFENADYLGIPIIDSDRILHRKVKLAQ